MCLFLCVCVCVPVHTLAILHFIFTPSALIPPSIQLTPLPHSPFHRQREGVGSTSASLLISLPTLPLSHNALLQSTEYSAAASHHWGQPPQSVLLCLLLLQSIHLLLPSSILHVSISWPISLYTSISIDYWSLCPFRLNQSQSFQDTAPSTLIWSIILATIPP